MRTDPTDTGGLFTGRRPGTAKTRYRTPPSPGSPTRRRADGALAFAIAALMAIVNLLFWGPIPAGALWAASRLDYVTDDVFLSIVAAFALVLGALFAGLAILKRLDAAWIVVRRAAGHDQRRGIIGPMFAVCAVVGGSAFVIWLVLIAGLGSSTMPGQGP